MAEALSSKGQILRDGGFIYSFDRMVYFNRAKKIVFSIEFVEDNDETELQKRIAEQSNGVDWRFYFKSPPSDAVRRELANVLA
jgi:hypothetical protein